MAASEQHQDKLDRAEALAADSRTDARKLEDQYMMAARNTGVEGVGPPRIFRMTYPLPAAPRPEIGANYDHN